MVSSKKITFKKGLLPVIIQEAKTKDVLMLGYMNREAFEKTMETGFVYFWSRERNKLWKKGEESGNLQKVKGIRVDCDRDSILIEVEQIGAACHRGYKSCFYRKLDGRKREKKMFDERTLYSGNPRILLELFDVINDRRRNPKKNSYTSGIISDKRKIMEKMREEMEELIDAKGKKNITWEAADLFYFLLVFLANKDADLVAVFEELKRRRTGG